MKKDALFSLEVVTLKLEQIHTRDDRVRELREEVVSQLDQMFA